VLKISCASLHNDFVELDKMQVNIQGVKRELRRNEQIDSRLYNNKDTQRVIQELGRTQMNNNNFANFVSSPGRHWQKNAVGQNLIPDSIFITF